MKFQAVTPKAAAIPPTFAQSLSFIPNCGPTVFTIKEATPTLSPRPINVTMKNWPNSLCIPSFPIFSKAQNLSPKYLAQVATTKEIPLKTEYQSPMAIPEVHIKKFNTPKSVMVARTPINKYFASWKTHKNLFPIKKLIQVPTNAKIGKETAKIRPRLSIFKAAISFNK